MSGADAPFGQSPNLSPPEALSPAPPGRSTEAGTPAAETASVLATEAGATPFATAPGTIVHGVVLAADGRPIEGVSVAIGLDEGARAHVMTDALGRYILGPFAPARRVLTAGKRNYKGADVALEFSAVGGVLRQDLTLFAQQVVRVRLVTSDGSPALSEFHVAGLHARSINLVPVATREDPGTTFTEVRGSLENLFGIGSFRQAGFAGFVASSLDHYGSVTVHEPAPCWLSLVCAHQVLAKQEITPDVEEVVFTLDPEDITALHARLVANVVDAATGAPLEAEAWVDDNPFALGTPMGRSNSAGELVLENLLPGKRWLLVRFPGRALKKQAIELERGAELRVGTISLFSPVELSGVVSDASGKTFQAKLRWGVLDEATQRVAWAVQVSDRSEPDGTFTLRDLARVIHEK